MNIDQIEAFLSIVEYGNINEASKHLFISQSSLSTRIKSLEEDLGFSLFIREKGVKKVFLTSCGEEFLKIAKQMNMLKEMSYKIKNLNLSQTLKIASVDAVNNFTFVPLYKSFMQLNKNIKLDIKTHHSNEIHNLVATSEADIGFVYNEIKHPDVISKPIFRELNYLVCHKDSNYYDDIELSKLDLSKEIFINWGRDFYQWHFHFFGENTKKLLTVNTGSLLYHYLNEPGNWSIAPMSVIKSFKESGNIVYYKLKNTPPPKICYMVTRKNKNLFDEDKISKFENLMMEFIESNYSICTFHTWMME
ncbi:MULTISPECIES: LysR family transcriptional regulator [Helcococcus]|uniref:LysR family transcriptional regulator n=1 Tax=Helcococcus bovis TaxID=3153252 RepID=A0ABW9F4N0_9FIRM